MDPAAPGSAVDAVPVLLPPHRQDRDLHTGGITSFR